MMIRAAHSKHPSCDDKSSCMLLYELNASPSGQSLLSVCNDWVNLDNTTSRRVSRATVATDVGNCVSSLKSKTSAGHISTTPSSVVSGKRHIASELE